jgi:glutathione synthase/RimK-type ligase-like ATP-grasp enzyme
LGETNGVVVKVLAKPGIRSGDRVATLYTHLLTEEDLDHLAAVKYGPTLLQKYIEKSADIRVTIIGDSAYSVAIKPTQKAVVDFRAVEIFNLPHSIIELPPKLTKLCVQLVRRLNLTFGAIDLVLTAAGEYYFLEINPNGQWSWLELITGIPLTKAMCDLLSRSYVSA